MNRFTNLLTYYPQAKHLGFKLRCGGITSDTFPEAYIVANAIHLCREKALPIKFTAGLHHPLSHFNSSLNTRMYGFFNILGAAVLSYTHLLSLNELEEMITEESGTFIEYNTDGNVVQKGSFNLDYIESGDYGAKLSQPKWDDIGNEDSNTTK